MRPRIIASALVCASLAVSTVAHAQPAPPPAPPPASPPPAQPDAPPPSDGSQPPPVAQPAPAPQPQPAPPPAPPPQTWGVAQPPPPATYPPPGPPAGPAPQGYAYGYGQFPPPGPPPPPLEPKEPGCCRFAVRFDPFDLLFRRLSFQAELAIWGPLSVEAEPSWIFGSSAENLDMSGGALQANFLVYFTGRALNGFYAKATVGFEAFSATLTDPELHKTATDDIASPIIGIAIGSSNVFGEEYGFNLAGGVGIGYATADKVTMRAGRYEVVFYDKTSAIQLLASLGLGFAF